MKSYRASALPLFLLAYTPLCFGVGKNNYSILPNALGEVIGSMASNQDLSIMACVDSHLRGFAIACPKTDELDLSNRIITVDQFKLLLETNPVFRNLRKLKLSKSSFSHELLSILPETIQSLDLQGCAVTADDLRHLHHLKNLTSLNLNDSDSIDDQTVHVIVTQFPNLTRLLLRPLFPDAHLTKDAVIELLTLKHLVEVDLSNHELAQTGIILDDDGTNSWKLPATLRVLKVSNSSLSPEQLEVITQDILDLEELDYSNNPVLTFAPLERLLTRQSEKLKILNLNHLRFLNPNLDPIGAAFDQLIGRMIHLQSVSVGGAWNSRIADSIPNLFGLPQLQHLDLSDANITIDLLSTLPEQQRNLKSLSLTWNAQFNVDQFKEVLELFPNLELLGMIKANQVTITTDQISEVFHHPITVDREQPKVQAIQHLKQVNLIGADFDNEPLPEFFHQYPQVVIKFLQENI